MTGLPAALPGADMGRRSCCTATTFASLTAAAAAAAVAVPQWETNAIVLQASHAAAAPGFSVSMTFRSDRRSIMTQWPAEVVAAVIAAVDEEAGGPPPGVAAASAQVAAPARSAPAAVSA